MATFEVNVVRVDEVLDHPNADRLSIVKIGDFNTISAKLDDGSHRYQVGDLVVYVPESAIVPEYLLKRGFWNPDISRGILSGSAGNRVKAIKLRGIVSQGILFPVIVAFDTHPEDDGKVVLEGHYFDISQDQPEYISVAEGQNVAESLGIIKWEPTLPAHMTGVASNLGPQHTVNFDVENIQKFNRSFDRTDNVFVQEKIHGTFMQVGFNSEGPWKEGLSIFGEDNIFVASKGLGAKGIVFENTESNVNGNLYVKTFFRFHSNFMLAYEYVRSLGYRKVWILGEVFGHGVQDMSYGYSIPSYRFFDIQVEDDNGHRHFLPLLLLENVMAQSGLQLAPVLYEGPFDRDVILPLVSGQTTITGDGTKPLHIREGVVIRSLSERKMLKWISPDYLLRKDKNATEFQ